MSWQVHKFGGTSLSTAHAYLQSSSILLSNHQGRSVAVVSAQGVIKSASGCLEEDKVTSILYECLELASARNPKVHIVLKQLRDRHFRVAKDLLGGDSLELKRFLEELDEDFVDLEQILRTVWLCGGSWKQDWWTGYGEIWSARLMAAFLGKTKKVDWLDARKVLVVKPHPMGVVPDIETSKRKLAEWISQNQHLEIIVVTGYICSLADGSPCTLGRDGSDYSASIFAVLCDAASVTIWTDVDGVYSANPNVVKNAVVRPQLSYAEAMELAYFGAKVIHPKTMTPVIVHKIPVYIRNTFAPQNPGSCICAPEFIKKSPVVTQGFSCIQNLALVNVEGSGMIGVPGVARRLFQAVQEAQCSVVLITQAGSEHSISFAVPFSQSDTVVKAICKEFQNELESKEIQTVEKTGPVACLASVGDGMKRTTGMAGKVLGALASKEINIIAIAQGSSERNISVIIDQKEADIAVKVVHDSFVNMDSKISCCLIVENESQLPDLVSTINQLNCDDTIGNFEIRGICTSSKMAFGDFNHLSLDEISKSISSSKLNFDPESIQTQLHDVYSSGYVIIDGSWSEKTISHYPQFLAQEMHVICAHPLLALLPEIQTLPIDYNSAAEAIFGPNSSLLHLINSLSPNITRIKGIFPTAMAAIIGSLSDSKTNSLQELKTKPFLKNCFIDAEFTILKCVMLLIARVADISLSSENISVDPNLKKALNYEGRKSILEFLSPDNGYLTCLDEKISFIRSNESKKNQTIRLIGTIENDGTGEIRLAIVDSASSFGLCREFCSNVTIEVDSGEAEEYPYSIQSPWPKDVQLSHAIANQLSNYRKNRSLRREEDF